MPNCIGSAFFMKGMIALDIDGTITFDHRHLDREVISFFNFLSKEGWVFVFITGRTFLWGYEVLRDLDFPYYIAVHNGATILEMPSRHVVAKKYLHIDCLESLDCIFNGRKTDYIIYTEKETGPLCYYRPNRMPEYLQNYLKERTKVFKEEWIPLDSYNDLPVTEFSALKYFGPKDEADLMILEFERLDLHAPMIKDPFNTDYYIIQATHSEVSKGHALRQLKDMLQLPEGRVIAAGDDNNDATMLASADIRVVMATAPEYLLKKAHVIAPSAHVKGIIKGLKSAIALVKE